MKEMEAFVHSGICWKKNLHELDVKAKCKIIIATLVILSHNHIKQQLLQIRLGIKGVKSETGYY